MLEEQAVSSSTLGKALESAVAFAQSLSQWAYITIGASVALLFRDLSQRPKTRFVRCLFLLFLPGWVLLILSIYEGLKVHGVYIAYLMSEKPDAAKAVTDANTIGSCQLLAVKWGIGIFLLWLAVYLIWWIIDGGKRQTNETLNQP